MTQNRHFCVTCVTSFVEGLCAKGGRRQSGRIRGCLSTTSPSGLKERCFPEHGTLLKQNLPRDDIVTRGNLFEECIPALTCSVPSTLLSLQRQRGEPRGSREPFVKANGRVALMANVAARCRGRSNCKPLRDARHQGNGQG